MGSWALVPQIDNSRIHYNKYDKDGEISEICNGFQVSQQKKKHGAAGDSHNSDPWSAGLWPHFKESMG